MCAVHPIFVPNEETEEKNPQKVKSRFKKFDFLGPSHPLMSPIHPPTSSDSIQFEFPQQSRLRQLLLPEPAEEARADDNLRQQPDPEPRLLQPVQADRQVREDGPRPRGVGGAGARDDGGDGPEHLGADQREHDVEAGQGLEEDHAEANALDGVEGAEPEPEGAAGEGAGDGGARPGHPGAHTGDGPQHLAPAGGTEADGEHGEDPRVAERGAGENGEQDGPDADEEGEDEKDYHPRLGVDRAPEVAPVAAVGRGEEEVLDEDGDEEPEDDLAARDRFVEAWDLTGRLAVIVWETKE